MRYVIANQKKPLFIGRKGENGVTTVRFPLGKIFPWLDTPEGIVFRLTHQRHTDEAPYELPFTLSDGFLEWLVSGFDVDEPGNGVAQITASTETMTAKSGIFSTEVEGSLDTAG